jgi:hypothetical protein
MLLEYYATDSEDLEIERILKNKNIIEWFNPEEDYYVMETDDETVVTILCLLGIEVFIHPDLQESDK